MTLQSSNPYSKSAANDVNSDDASTMFNKQTDDQNTDKLDPQFHSAKAAEAEHQGSDDCRSQSTSERSLTDPNFIFKHSEDEYVDQFLDKADAPK